MGTLFGHHTVIEHHNVVGILDGAELMRNDQHGGGLSQFGDGILYGFLHAGVEGRSCFVEQDDGGLLEQGPGNTDTLAFAAGQHAAAFTHPGFPAVRQTLGDLGDAGTLRGSANISGACLRVAVGDVGLQGVVKEVDVLEDQGQHAHEIRGGVAADVLPSDGDGAGGDVPEAGDEAGDGGFS